MLLGESRLFAASRYQLTASEYPRKHCAQSAWPAKSRSLSKFGNVPIDSKRRNQAFRGRICVDVVVGFCGIEIIVFIVAHDVGVVAAFFDCDDVCRFSRVTA